MNPRIILKKLTFISIISLIYSNSYNLDNCETSIAPDVPQFFHKYFNCVTARMSESGQYINIYFNGLPPYATWYYSPNHNNHIPWEDQIDGCSDGSSCNLGVCLNGEHCYFQVPASIEEQNHIISIPISPLSRELIIDDFYVDGLINQQGVTYDYPMGSVGVANNGVNLFGPLAGPGDVIEDEAYSFDLYSGHPTGGDSGGEYHYHTTSQGPLELLQYKMPNQITNTSPGYAEIELYGIMCDGVIVMGCTELNGTILTQQDYATLDAQNGHAHDIIDEENNILFENRYHTHICYTHLSNEDGPNGFEYHEFTPEVSYYKTPGMGESFDRCSAMSEPYEANKIYIQGCTDSTACNYNSSAEIDDDSCEYLSCENSNSNSAIHPIELSIIYPNPFNPSTSIDYFIDKYSKVLIEVYSLDGKRIAKIVDRYHSPGKYNIQWIPKNITTGTYFIKMSNNSFSKTKKIIYLK